MSVWSGLSCVRAQRKDSICADSKALGPRAGSRRPPVFHDDRAALSDWERQVSPRHVPWVSGSARPSILIPVLPISLHTP